MNLCQRKNIVVSFQSAGNMLGKLLSVGQEHGNG